MSHVAGADGARVDGQAGWVVVHLVGGRLDAIRFTETLEAGLESIPPVEVLAVDIPIGHEDPTGDEDEGRRQADSDARERLGPRSASVFSVPPLDLFEAETHSDASEQASQRGTIAPSAQVWNLKDRILEANRLARGDDRLHEAHPEVSFHVMSVQHGTLPATLAHKRSFDGLFQRLDLLEGVGLKLPGRLDEAGHAAPHDVLDAVATAWTAHRIAEDDALTFPADPLTDPDTGREVAIHA